VNASWSVLIIGRTLTPLGGKSQGQVIYEAVDACARTGIGCSLRINDQIIKLDPKQAQLASDTIVVADLKGFLRICYLAACAYLGEEPPAKPIIEPTPIERPAGSGSKPGGGGTGPKPQKPS